MYSAPVSMHPGFRTWSATDRLAASNKLNAVLDDEVGLRAFADAASESIMTSLSAAALRIVLIDSGGFRDLINVGELAPGEHRFPEEAPYHPNETSAVTTRQLAFGRFVTLGTSVEVLRQHQEFLPGDQIGRVLGAPIGHVTELRGEIYLMRNRRQPPFIREDELVACDLAALFGMRLIPLLESGSNALLPV